LFVGCEFVNLLICSCLIESHLGVKKNQWSGMRGEGRPKSDREVKNKKLKKKIKKQYLKKIVRELVECA
jgi:hypothetical protein